MSKPFPINHDLHCHSRLSSCCHDDSLTVDSIMTFAKAHQYDLVAVTDHFWDSTVPGANNWYAPQNLKHIQQSLPLPRDEKVRFLFGCETEYCGGGKLGIAPEHFPLFDIIVIPVNHFHMEGFVRPSSCDTPEKLAELLTERLEELCQLSLPWEKVGIAHLNGCFFLKGEGYSRNMRLISEDRVRAVFRFFAEKGRESS